MWNGVFFTHLTKVKNNKYRRQLTTNRTLSVSGRKSVIAITPGINGGYDLLLEAANCPEVVPGLHLTVCIPLLDVVLMLLVGAASRTL